MTPSYLKFRRCRLTKPGSNVLVAGTAIFGSKDPKKTITEMRTQVDQALDDGEKAHNAQNGVKGLSLAEKS